MERVLVTGIEPFDGDKVNPSWQVAQALAGERIAGAEVVVRQLACVLGLSNQQLDCRHRRAAAQSRDLPGAGRRARRNFR
ncbi:Pyrrolidone-carboxylate peptidase [Serratia liquefaciens]|nr:Pyrrolidone-carboxylate peptidase [Serratia liquefaciens]